MFFSFFPPFPSPPSLLNLCLRMVIGRCCWKLLKSFVKIWQYFAILSLKGFYCVSFLYICDSIELAALWCSGLIPFDPLGNWQTHCLWSKSIRPAELMVRPKSSRGGSKLANSLLLAWDSVLKQVFQTFLYQGTHGKWLYLYDGLLPSPPWLPEGWERVGWRH